MKRKMGLPRKEEGIEIDKTKPHFYTIIHSPSLQLHKLRLPKKFVNDDGKDLSNVGYLRVPNGTDWLVEMVKCKGNVWVSRGWNQFAEHYSIAYGYFLLFRYDGGSRFRVLIYSPTAVEIHYSHYPLHPSASQSCKFRSPNAEIFEQGVNDDTWAEMLDQLQPQLVKKQLFEEPTGQRNLQAGSKIRSDAKNRVQQRAKAFESRNPFFNVEIRKRNLSTNCGAVFPVSHYRKHFKVNDGNKDIVLRIHEKTWHIKSRREKFRPFSLSLTFGWKDFVLNNELKEGDNCVFELIDKATKTYNVHLFRISEHNLLGEEMKGDIPIETSGRRGKNKKLGTRARRRR